MESYFRSQARVMQLGDKFVSSLWLENSIVASQVTRNAYSSNIAFSGTASIYIM